MLKEHNIKEAQFSVDTLKTTRGQLADDLEHLNELQN